MADDQSTAIRHVGPKALATRLRVGSVDVSDGLIRADMHTAAALIDRLSRQTEWRDIETAPKSPTPEGRFQRVLFRGISTGRSFNHPAVVDGWVGSDGEPVHCYTYRLRITHWMPLPEEPR